MRLNVTEAALMHTVFFCMGQGKNHSTQASIDKFLELLAKYHDTHIKRSWLFECFRHLEDTGYMKRRTRYLRAEAGHIRQIPSLWSFTMKGIRWLLSKGVEKAQKLKLKMIEYFKREDGRFPLEKDFSPPEVDPKARKDIERAERIAEIVTKPID